MSHFVMPVTKQLQVIVNRLIQRLTVCDFESGNSLKIDQPMTECALKSRAPSSVENTVNGHWQNTFAVIDDFQNKK